MRPYIVIFLLLLSLSSNAKTRLVKLIIDQNIENKHFLERKIATFLSENNCKIEDNQASFTISLSLIKGMNAEAYALQNKENGIEIKASDKNGLIYGSYEFMRQAKQNKGIEKITNTNENPHFGFRAIKFNLPYMAYRTNKSATQHDAICRDIKFWEKYLDMMVENRYNVLSLWSLHLAHYMIIPEKYPEASHYNTYEMYEWKRFWTQLFAMAKERGIDTYLVNWNTFVSPGFARSHNIARYCEKPSHYGEIENNELVEDYTREVTRQIIDEYPDLTGLGITLGERMGGQTADERRAWLDRTIFEGMRQAKRKIKFIYRAPLSANKNPGGSTSEENDRKTREQIEKLDVIGPVWVEFKYNWSHGHSSPNLFIVHGGKLTDQYYNPEPTKYKYIWTVRNEDFFVHRWSGSDFIRSFIANNSQSYVSGCFIGSEVFIPALDYTSKEGAHKNWTYSFERLWMWYTQWGELLYNPQKSDSYFVNLTAQKYGEKHALNHFNAANLIGKTPLMFASFHRGQNDLSLYTEGFCSWGEEKDAKLFNIDAFCSHLVLDTIRYINIEDYVTKPFKITKHTITPLQLADSLDNISNSTMKLIANIGTKDISPTLDCELKDTEAWVWFARYFADKLRAGVALTEYRKLGKPQKDEAIRLLEKCKLHWENYAKTTTIYNKEEFLFQTKENFSWFGMLDQVNADIELAKKSTIEK